MQLPEVELEDSDPQRSGVDVGVAEASAQVEEPRQRCLENL